MPYSGPSDAKLPKNVKALPINQRRRWVSVWDSSFSRCQREGGKDCESVAFRLANGVVLKERDMSSVIIDGLSVDISELIAAFKQQGGANRGKLREAQERRSKKYGIAVQGSGALTIPARFAQMGAREGDFADPIHYRYPIWLSKNPDSITPAQLGQVRNALPRFEQNKNVYDTRSRAAVESRIDQARKKFKVGEFAETEKADVEWQCEIAKLDMECQVAIGPVLKVSRVGDIRPDSQRDTVTAEQVEEAAYNFMIKSRFTDLHHKARLPHKRVAVVESYLAPVDFMINKVEVKKGDWVAGVKFFDNELWEAVKRGEIQAFSIKGRGIRRPMRITG